MSIRSTFLLAAGFLGVLAAAAKEQYVFKPTAAASSAVAVPGAHGYAYIGCWNETIGFRRNGGARALAGGRDFSKDTMTTSMCLEFCAERRDGKVMQYAGLQYGRECWCAPSLSDLSEKLNESSRCIYSCGGNASEICGGQLALTLYNLTSSLDSKTGIAWSQFSGVAGYGTLAVVTLIIAAIL